MWKTLLTFTLIGTTQHMTGQSAGLHGPPTILDLGSNVNDGSVTVKCNGKEPYSELSCKVYRLWVQRLSIDEYQKARAALQNDLATKSEEDLRKMQQVRCSDLPSVNSDLAKNLKNYSPGRAASARDGYDQMKALCGCTTKQCITSVMLEQQTHDENECTVHSTVFAADFVKVGDRKWVSNNGPEGICGVVSVFTIEHEAASTVLWTYTEQYTYTNNSEGLCKGLPSRTTSTYSWKSGRNVRLKCEELKFETLPERQ
jgi:hypothetical protein